MTSAKSIDGLLTLVSRFGNERCNEGHGLASRGEVNELFRAIRAYAESLAQPERQRIERLRGALKSASGWLLDAGDLDNSQACLRMAGDAEAPAVQPDVDALSEAIMNLPAGNVELDWTQAERACYKIGHRDARHAAAELLKVKP